MDAKYSKSTTALCIITGVDNSSLSKKDLGIYLETKTQESKETISLETLDHINEEALGMEMSDWRAKVRLETLLVPYHFILRHNGLSRVLTLNKEVSNSHFLSAIRPSDLHSRIKSDLNFSFANVTSDIHGFKSYAVRLSQAIEALNFHPEAS